MMRALVLGRLSSTGISNDQRAILMTTDDSSDDVKVDVDGSISFPHASSIETVLTALR